MNVARSSVCLTFVLSLAAFASASEPCRLEVVDAENGWPVPLVELRTINQLRFVSDNAGVIACDAPELFGRETWFTVIGHGYECPPDGFGYRGVRLTPLPGQTVRVPVNRTVIAKRLGRLTGAGLFAESQKLGQQMDIKETGVFGCDSLQLAEHRGRLLWTWGDTTLPHYPLGVFATSGATTRVNPLTTFEPPLHLAFDYFRDTKDRPRGLAPMPGKGPTWLEGLISLPDQNQQSRLVASYVKIRNHLEPCETGLCVWDDATLLFQRSRVLWTNSSADPKSPPIPKGHAVPYTDPTGRSWILFGNPFPALRCPATFEAWQDPAAWELLTPQASVPSAGDAAPIRPHTGSIAWSAWRHRWVTVFVQRSGTPSKLGELWYAESKTPTGPWGPAVKILTHENYTFYNPLLHAELTPAGSPILLFEGTYTAEFANHPDPTPRYNYNQILYRLDLDDSRLLPAKTQ